MLNRREDEREGIDNEKEKSKGKKGNREKRTVDKL